MCSISSALEHSFVDWGLAQVPLLAYEEFDLWHGYERVGESVQVATKLPCSLQKAARCGEWRNTEWWFSYVIRLGPMLTFKTTFLFPHAEILLWYLKYPAQIQRFSSLHLSVTWKSPLVTETHTLPVCHWARSSSIWLCSYPQPLSLVP